MHGMGYAQYALAIQNESRSGAELQSLSLSHCVQVMGFLDKGEALRFLSALHETLHGNCSETFAVTMMKQMDAQQVSEWLESKGMASWVNILIEENIDGRGVLHLNAADMLAMGLRSLKEAHMFFTARGALNEKW